MHANRHSASPSPATTAPEPGPAQSEQQLSAGLAGIGAVAGGISFCYGAVAATERYGPAPWAALAALLALGALLATAASAARGPLYAIADRSRAACYAYTVADRLSWAGPQAPVVAALAVWIPFAAYGLTLLAHGA